MIVVLAVFGLCTLAMALPFGVFWPFVPLAVTAVVTPLINVVVSALYTELVPEDMMGRLDGITTMASRVLTPLAPVLGGFLAGAVGGGPALLVLGALVLATAVAARFSDVANPLPRSSAASG